MAEILTSINWEPIFQAIWTAIIVPFLLWAKGKISDWAKEAFKCDFFVNLK